MVTPLDGYVFARLVADLPVNGELPSVSRPLNRLAAHLAILPALERPGAFQAGCAALGADGEELGRSILEIDPQGLPPEIDPGVAVATLADYARFASEQRWLWPGWIARGVFNAVASEPGTGKTRLGLDLARRMFLGLPWPDGQPTDLPEGTRTLWVQAGPGLSRDAGVRPGLRIAR